MSYDIAFVREQGMNFVVACMEDHVLSSTFESQQVCRALEAEHGVPVAIVGARHHKIFGDKRIIGWLASINLGALPWRRAYT